MKRDYELTVLIRGDLDEKVVSKTIKDIGELLTKSGAKFKSKDTIKKQMAYEIDGVRDANYVFFELELDPAIVLEVDSKVKLMENVMRYLLVKKV